MNTLEILEELQKKALQNEEVRQMFLATRKEEYPVSAFCKACQKLGYPLYEMDLIGAGEDFYAAMRRSTNGGGENSPMLEGEDDYYELFFCTIGAKED